MAKDRDDKSGYSQRITANKLQQSYQVKPGETMTSIAASAGISPEELARVNRGATPLDVGQTIRVPRFDTEGGPQSRPSMLTGPLAPIQSAYNTTMGAIDSAARGFNRLLTPNYIAGQKDLLSNVGPRPVAAQQTGASFGPTAIPDYSQAYTGFIGRALDKEKDASAVWTNSELNFAYTQFSFLPSNLTPEQKAWLIKRNPELSPEDFGGGSEMVFPNPSAGASESAGGGGGGSSSAQQSMKTPDADQFIGDDGNLYQRNKSGQGAYLLQYSNGIYAQYGANGQAWEVDRQTGYTVPAGRTSSARGRGGRGGGVGRYRSEGWEAAPPGQPAFVYQIGLLSLRASTG